MADGADNDWSTCRLDEVIDFNPRETLPKGTDAPYVEMAALPLNGRWHDEPALRVVSSGSRFRDGDTLLARITPCLENGKTAQVRGLGRGVVGWGSTEFIVMRAKPGLADPDFVYLLARDPGFREYAIQQMTGTSGRQRVPTESIASFEVSLPALTEQRRIAEVLNALDDRISQSSRLSLCIEEELQALFDVLVESDSQELPLTEIALVNPQLRISGGSEAPYVPMERVSTSGYRIKGATPRSVGSGARFRNGDTLVARITPCLENGKVGFVDLLKNEEVGWGSTEFIVLRGKTHIDPFIPYLIARSDEFRDYAVRHMSGSSGRQRCPAEAIERYRTLMPSDDGLARFSLDAAPRRETLKRCNDEADLARELRDFLLPGLLSGELRVAAAQELVEAAT